MLIGLHDAEFEKMAKKTFPNYALMKISAHHKQNARNTVEWWDNSKKYDFVYSSKVFDFTAENSLLPPGTRKGGTGYGVFEDLPPMVDTTFPDYSLYPACDYAVGFLTRGCIRSCDWCVVPKKEGKIRPCMRWNELVRKDTDKLVLMDNNILASDWGIEQLHQIADTKYLIDLNQGMDIRLVTPEIVKLIVKLKWVKYIRFSCDTVSQLLYFEKVVSWFKQYGAPVSRIFVYLLVRKDLADAEFRARELHRMAKSINIYAQAERNIGVVPERAQLEFAQRYIYGNAYKKESWLQYCERNNFKWLKEV